MPPSLLASRLQLISPSPTLAMSAKAAHLKSQGIDVLNLSTGEPDFETPLPIQEGAIRGIQGGMSKYTPVEGLLSLKKAIQQKFLLDNALSYSLDQIIVSTGGKQVLFNAFMATLNPGDEVVIPSPYWVSYPDITSLFSGIPICVPCTESNGFKITPAQLEKAITPRTKWFVLNSPANPSGQVYTADELKALGDVLLRFPHVLILSDDIYEYLIYEGNFSTLAQVVPPLFSRTLTLNGLSKSYAMTGWRLGYGAGPEALIQAMIMLQSQSTSNASSISQSAALAALSLGREEAEKLFLSQWRGSFKRRRDFCLQALRQIPGLSALCPAGAFYLYIQCQGLLNRRTPSGTLLTTDTQLCLYFLEEARVALVSGSAFGLSPYLRLSYATSDSILEESMKRLAQAVSRLQPQ